MEVLAQIVQCASNASFIEEAVKAMIQHLGILIISHWNEEMNL
jgi:hypothetical protein